MAGLTLGTTTSEVIKSPWLAFIGCAVPPLSSGKPGRITLATDAASGWNTPDATENPNGFFLGCTSKGWQGSGSNKTTQDFCDEFTTPLNTSIDEQTYVYEADLLSVINEKTLTTVFGLEALHVGSDAFLHFRQPSSPTTPQMTFLLLGRRLVGGVYKYTYVFAPLAQQTASFGQGNYTRTEMLKTKIRMEFQLYSAWATPYTFYTEE